MLQDERKKTARLEMRITPAIHDLVRRAAGLRGQSVSDFVVMAARQAAEEVIARHAIIDLSQADQERFAVALLQPESLAPVMERAAAAHRKLIEPS